MSYTWPRSNRRRSRGRQLHFGRGVPATEIARYTTATIHWSALVPGPPVPVLTLAVLPGGDLIAAAPFLHRGLSVHKIARFSAIAETWSALSSE